MVVRCLELSLGYGKMVNRCFLLFLTLTTTLQLKQYYLHFIYVEANIYGNPVQIAQLLSYLASTKNHHSNSRTEAFLTTPQTG